MAAAARRRRNGRSAIIRPTASSRSPTGSARTASRGRSASACSWAAAPAKPKDLETKLAALEAEPPVIDHLILLRPEDDLALTGKSKTLWQEAERRGRHARLEPVSLDAFAVLYGFPRWLAALTEALPEGQPLPNLADLLQETLREAAGAGVHAGAGVTGATLEPRPCGARAVPNGRGAFIC